MIKKLPCHFSVPWKSSIFTTSRIQCKKQIFGIQVYFHQIEVVEFICDGYKTNFSFHPVHFLSHRRDRESIAPSSRVKACTHERPLRSCSRARIKLISPGTWSGTRSIQRRDAYTRQLHSRVIHSRSARLRSGTEIPIVVLTYAGSRELI